MDLHARIKSALISTVPSTARLNAPLFMLHDVSVSFPDFKAGELILRESNISGEPCSPCGLELSLSWNLQVRNNKQEESQRALRIDNGWNYSI